MNTHTKQVERLAFFSDAVFAIAMTLLVIEIRVPRVAEYSDRGLAQALLDLTPNYIGFVISFLVIARFWTGHHRVIGITDTASPGVVRANLALLMAVAFMPFPTAVISNYSHLRLAVMFYAGYLIVLGLINMVFIRTALATERHEDHPTREADERALRLGVWTPVAIGALGAAAGFVRPVLGLLTMTVASPLILAASSHFARRRHT